MENTENQQVMKQKMKINTSGSLVNWLMSNNQTIPVVGMGATECLWSDRHAHEVLEVSTDCKTVIIDRYNPKRVDKMGMSDCQSYEYKELNNNPQTVVWYRGKWRFKGSEIVFTKEFTENCGNEFPAFALTDEQKKQVYDGNQFPKNVVDGITCKKTTYHPVHIIWGIKDEHYDFSF